MNTIATNTEKGSAPERSTSKQKTSKRKVGVAKPAKAAKAKPTSKKSAMANGKKTNAPADSRRDTKKAIVLELLRRKEGATIAEIAKATDWQNHSSA